jgi:hypothetical protein
LGRDSAYSMTVRGSIIDRRQADVRLGPLGVDSGNWVAAGDNRPKNAGGAHRLHDAKGIWDLSA